MKNKIISLIAALRFSLSSSSSKIHFFNTEPQQSELVVFSNELSVQADGWAQLAPYGDFPGKGFIRGENGTVNKFDAIQRMDKPAAQAMAAKFRSPWNKAKRFIKGCMIYNGHPNVPLAPDEYPDKEPKGMIADLEARDDGLFCLPVFTNEGEALLNQPRKLFFSGHWDSNELPEENGKRIFRPDQLKSAGLTSRPNLPVQHVNEKEHNPTPEPEMKKELILQLLAARGVQFANDATDDQIMTALTNLGVEATAAAHLKAEKTQWANERTSLNEQLTARTNTVTELTTERDTARTNFANERAARITSLLDGAVTSGRITAADRPAWEARLKVEANFANEAEALGKVGTVLKTVSITEKSGGQRKVEIANASQRADAVRQLVQVEMERNGGNYDKAYASVQQNNPALFEAMQKPKTA